MADIIAEVKSVTAANGWFFGKSYLRTEPLSAYDAVVVFAQVIVFDDQYPTLGTKQRLVPLNAENYSNLGDIVGNTVTDEETEIFYVTQFLPPEDD
ncbi:hypothetical protein [Aliirhizobium smilacinae]|uniref:Uncharacterized protein n=1 Tax=Aliirhizobium smilacinae TaxID=1395944 RepID=A0A5C4XPH1_9HYPH|nr:hypothetical protein [Rhizobium smilacinae]TNM65237.1 hypothetical protein FHP24_02840 [Rhizobium smilacinae]